VNVTLLHSHVISARWIYVSGYAKYYSRWCMIKRINANKKPKNVEEDVNSGNRDGSKPWCII